jgi:hypothetical protein
MSLPGFFSPISKNVADELRSSSAEVSISTDIGGIFHINEKLCITCSGCIVQTPRANNNYVS